MSPRLGELLVRDGACSEGALRAALQNQVIFGGRLGTNLLEIKAVTEEALSHALAKQHGIPAMFGRMRLDPAAVALVRPEIAERCEALPYVVAGRSVAVLVSNPKDLAMLDEVAFATGKEVHPIVVPEARIWALLREAYGVDRHLRGLEVDFARLPRGDDGPRGPAAAPPPAGEDLMDEGAFDALYGRVGLTAPPPPPVLAPEEVIDLTDLVAPQPTPTPVPAPGPRPTPPRIAALDARVLAALSAAPGHAPPERPWRPAPPREEPEPSPLGFQDAIRFLEGVDERSSIAKTVLRYARSRFRRAVLLTVQRGVARGWAGLGVGGPAAVRRLQLSLHTPGIVETVVRTRAHFLGPIPKTDANIRLLKGLGGGVPANAFLVPILALGRVVNVFYADAGRGGVVDTGEVGELLILAARIAKSYDALLARVQVRV